MIPAGNAQVTPAREACSGEGGHVVRDVRANAPERDAVHPRHTLRRRVSAVSGQAVR